MNNIDRYDEEVKNVDPDEVERIKRKKSRIRQRILFAAKLAIYHIAAWVLYVIIFSPATDAEVAHDTGAESSVLVFFCLLATVFFSLFISLELSSKGENRRDFSELMKTAPFTPRLFWQLSAESVIAYGIIHFVFQLPFVIFYHFFGFSYAYPTVIDNFYVLDAGLMELTGIGIVGAILNTLLFAALHTLFRFMTYRRWKSEIL